MLKKQVARLEAMRHDGLLRLRARILSVRRDLRGGRTTSATASLKTAGYYIEDYHIFQTTKEEGVMRAIRNGLQGAGIPVENSKGEWGPGQEEINVRYADALDDGRPARDPQERRARRSPTARARPSPSWRSGTTASPARRATSTRRCGTRPARRRCSSTPKAEHGMSTLMRQFVAGPARIRARDHLFPRALHQLLQALPGRHLRADQGDLEPRQPHRRLPAVRRGHARRSASSAASAAPTSIPISPSRR